MQIRSNVLLALNIADDYYKAKKQGDSLESDIELKDKDMYDSEARVDFGTDQTGECREGAFQDERGEQRPSDADRKIRN